MRRQARRCPTCGQRFSGDGRFCPFDGVRLEPAPLEGDDDALLGSTIDGRYEVLEFIGEGGTGRVYKVRHAALARLFAMKVLRGDLARDQEIAARFIQEAKATASIRHPNVVEITDFGRLTDGVPYIVMELLLGRTLGDLMKNEGPLPPVRAAPILRQIAGALGAAHALGIVHRDLKPDNVFLLEDSAAVRVVDFGAAKVVGASRVTRDGVVFGTPHYMSPEQAGGQPLDHRADIYSLGVIMYEMFTGRVPFEADTYMGILTQHMFVQPTPPSQAAQAPRELGALEDITLRCLSKRPEDRYASMEELASDIDRTVGGGAASTRAAVLPGEGARNGLGARRARIARRLLVGAAAATCSAVALALLVQSVVRRAARAPISPASGQSAVPVAPLPPAAIQLAERAPEVPAVSAGAPPAAPSAEAGARAAVAPSRPVGGGAAGKPRPAAARPHPTPMDDVGDPFAGSR
ncbi:MAG TPA: serine/threonine-protein kinase [Polyangiaceae bacterium]|nr:serine/threonine-protein kinase [Polyangiaceae bacterium]